jgi:hypothetical protein
MLQSVNQPLYFCLNSLRSGEKMRHIPGSARPSSKLVLPLVFTRIGASRLAPFLSRQTRLLVRASTTRPSVKMRLPLYLWESFIYSIRSPVSTRRGCCFSQVMPFPI